jgi:cyclophilin family peptidyl-prolyl cis-trans isomerase
MRTVLMCLALLVPAACTSSETAGRATTRADTAAVANIIPAPQAEPMRSPDRWRARFETSKGSFDVEVTRALAPRAADRFHEMVRVGYFSGVRFFRMKPGFIVQFGAHGDPAVNAAWNPATFPDEPRRTGNTRGTMAFAASGPDSRAAQLFINTGDNRRALDGQKIFAPFARVVQGMEVVDALNTEYGEEPNHVKIIRQGNKYLRDWFPALDSIVAVTFLPQSTP